MLVYCFLIEIVKCQKSLVSDFFLFFSWLTVLPDSLEIAISMYKSPQICILKITRQEVTKASDYNTEFMSAKVLLII